MVVRDVLCQVEVDMMGGKYLVYLKEVPSRLHQGKPVSSCVKAFVKKI